jgi:hypothetical protein
MTLQGGLRTDTTEDGIDTRSASSITVSDVNIYNHGGAGISLSTPVHVLISDSKITNNTLDGVLSTAGTTVTISHCYLNLNQRNGVNNLSTGSFRILDSVMEQNGSFGAFLGSSGLFTGNELESNVMGGVKTTSTVYIAGNLILPGNYNVPALFFSGESSTFSAVVANVFGSSTTSLIKLDPTYSKNNWIGPNSGLGTSISGDNGHNQIYTNH